MFGKILVPLDGSELAEGALDYVLAVPRTKRTKVVLLSVVAHPGEPGDHPMKAYLDATVQRLEDEGVNASAAIAYGHAAHEIVEFAEENQADLIVMSSHGYSGVKLRILGSIAQEVLHRTCVPLLLVKPKGEKGTEVAWKKVLVPLDGSPFSESAIGYVAEVVKGSGSEIVLVRVSEPPMVPVTWSRDVDSHRKEYQQRLTGEMQQQAIEYLEGVRATLGKKRMKVKPLAVVGVAPQSILDTAEKENADLLVMSTHGRSGVSRWVYGSVVNEVVQRCVRPMLLVRPCRPESPRPK